MAGNYGLNLSKVKIVWDEETMPDFSRRVRLEREYQIEKWGVKNDLEVNTPMDWVGYIARHSTGWFNGGFRPYSKETLRDFQMAMVKVATLALAAYESTEKIINGEVDRPDLIVPEEKTDV